MYLNYFQHLKNCIQSSFRIGALFEKKTQNQTIEALVD